MAKSCIYTLHIVGVSLDSTRSYRFVMSYLVSDSASVALHRHIFERRNGYYSVSSPKAGDGYNYLIY